MRDILFNKKNKELYLILSIYFFLFCIAYRISSILTIIQTGGLLDLRGYHNIASLTLFGNVHSLDIIRTTMGPPFVLLPYVPFAFFPFTIANYILAMVNFSGFICTFYLLWKKFLGSLSYLFYIFLGLLFFSFPVSYGLGMGNPMGVVTLGCYAFILFSERKKITSFLITYCSFLKIFPIVSIPAYIIIFPKDERLRKHLYIFLIIFTIISLLIIPRESWGLYLNEFISQYVRGSAIDISIYNQSFLSSLYRMNVHMQWIFILFLIGILFVTYGLARKIYTSPIHTNEKLLHLTVLFLASFLLLHPFPWQYYFSIFIPFLFVRIAKGELLYLFSLILISIDGNKIPISFMKGFIDSSQWLGTLLLLFILFWYARKLKHV